MYESVPQRPLPVLATPSHDERARQLFAKDFRKYIMLDVPPLTRRVYEQEVKPAVVAARGAAPTTHTEVRDVMWEHGFLRAAQGLQRISQELMWGSIVPVGGAPGRRDQCARGGAVGARRRARWTSIPEAEVPEYLTRGSTSTACRATTTPRTRRTMPARARCSTVARSCMRSAQPAI
jgi:hypothetical protein